MRTSGFEKPFSRDQVTSWIIQLLLISSFITFVATLLSYDKCLAILLPNAALVIIVVWSWSICESRDPAKPKPPVGIVPSVLRVPYKESRYCGLCYKSSPGLDHHCTWLNTCIAESNYESFYCLVLTATFQTLLQAVVGILMCTLWHSEVKANAVEGWSTAVIALLWIHNIACVSIVNSFFLLAGFHTYLLYVGMGTYDFILENGSEGLCTRMLKCNCLRRSKSRNPKCSHVQHGDVNDTKGAKAAAVRSRRGSPPASIVPVSHPSLRVQTSLELAAATAAADQELHHTSDPTNVGTRKDQDTTSPAGVKSTELVDSAALAQQHQAIDTSVNESEGIFEDVDLGSSQLKPPRKPSVAALVPATSEQ